MKLLASSNRLMKTPLQKSNMFVVLTVATIAFGTVSLRADYAVTGYLDVEKNIDFGTTSANPPTSAVLIAYSASSLTARCDLTPNNGIFLWRDNVISGQASLKMRLEANNTLSLHNSVGAATISLNPVNGQIDLTGTGSGIYSNGTAVFTVNSSGNLVFASRPFNFSSTAASTSSTTGALTIAGGLGVASDSYINGIRFGRGGSSNASNTAVGFVALAENTTASYNTAIGHSALTANTTGATNTATGYYSLKSNITGGGNTAIGSMSLVSNTAGIANTAIGKDTLYDNTVGESNVALGANALRRNTTGTSNIALGDSAGSYLGDGASYLTDPVGSIYIGAHSRGFSNEDDNSIVIGASAVGEGANTTVIGNSTTTKTHLYGETVADSLSVTNNVVLNGQVILAGPQGDISMGDYAE